jgi:hypothetical protein
MGIRVTYAVTVCNEFLEIQRLLNFLLQNKRLQDNIVVLFDEANGDPEVETFLRTHSINGEFAWYKDKFNKHFSDWKNKISSLCSGDYIVNIDADEIPNSNLLSYLPEILEENPEIDVFRVPRINTVKGITQEHIDMWGWKINEDNWINYPDYQTRVYKNNSTIKWEGKVHETLIGYKTIAELPALESFSLYHPKDIKRQEKQNKLYNEI